MAGITTGIGPYLGTGAIGAAGLAVKRMVGGKQCDEYAKGKEKHLRVPKGYVAYKMRLGVPVKKHGQPVALKEGDWLRFFGIESLRYVNTLPQMHSIPDVSVLPTSGISFKVTPYLGYKITDGYAAEFEVADWKKYLVESATTLFSHRFGAVEHEKLLDSTEIDKLTKELNAMVGDYGIEVYYLGFKIEADEIGKMILGQCTLGKKRVEVLKIAAQELGNEDGLDPMVAYVILGGSLFATGAPNGPGLSPGKLADLHVINPGADNAAGA